MEDGELSIACARWEPEGLAPTLLDDLQESISVEIRRGGRAWFATTRHERETWLRFNMVNLHTRKEHVDALVQLVSDTARRLSPR